MWWPHTIRPNNAIMNKAINIGSLPNIIHWLNLEIISLIKPKAGKINIYTSGWLENQGKCWGNNNSPPLIGSRKGRLEWVLDVIL